MSRFQKFLWYWRSQQSLIVELSASEAQCVMLVTQLDELRMRAQPVVDILRDDGYWGGLDEAGNSLAETLDFLDETY